MWNGNLLGKSEARSSRKTFGRKRRGKEREDSGCFIGGCRAFWGIHKFQPSRAWANQLRLISGPRQTLEVELEGHRARIECSEWQCGHGAADSVVVKPYQADRGN
jgi:hypothetical protein